MSSILSDFFSKATNSFMVNIFEVSFNRYNKVILKILDLLDKERKLIKNFQIDKRMLKVNFKELISKINVISPRFSIKVSDFEKFKKRYLISEKIGSLIISTSKGIFFHQEAKLKNLGGILLGYYY